MQSLSATYHLVGDFDEKGSHTLRSVIVAGYFYPCFDGLRASTSPRSQIRDCITVDDKKTVGSHP